MSRRAFEGIRVLDFTQVLAGPFATQQLAALGAEVIKVEQPGTGDMTRAGLAGGDSAGVAPSFLTCNLGKQSITLDLKHAQAAEIVRRLVSISDVLVENFKPGVMQRLGFDYAQVRQWRDDIVYCSISGYGQSGPRAATPAFDGAIQASSGLMSLTGYPDTGPTRAGYFVVDMSTALNTAFAISSALYRRAVTGEGQHVDVAMLDTALMLEAPQMTAYFASGQQPELLGNRSPTKQATANVFQTADGFVQVIALKNTQAHALFKAIGHPELTDAYPDARDRVAGFDALSEVLRAALQQHDTRYWLQTLDGAGVPVSEVRALAEVAADTQLTHRHSITAAILPDGSRQQSVGAAFMTDRYPPQSGERAPDLGEHTDRVLQLAGYSAAEISALRQAGAC